MRSSTIVAASCAGLVALAFVAAPKACEWGVNAYLWTGAALLLLLPTLPFLIEPRPTIGKRVVVSLGYAALVCVTWVAGLFVANMRIICRLF